jgi:integrase
MASVNGIDTLYDDAGKVRGWKVRYRAGGKPRSQTFLVAKGHKLRDARSFKVTVEHAKQTLTYVDPALGQVSLRDYGDRWQRAQAPLWTPRTITQVRQVFECHIYPDLGEDTYLRDLGPTVLKAFRTNLYGKLVPRTAAHYWSYVRALLDEAVLDGRLPRNPCVFKFNPPAKEEQSIRPEEIPTLDELDAIAKELPRWWRALVPVGAGTGLRPGELVGLTAGQVNFTFKTLTVDRQHEGEPPKYRSVRAVPVDDVTLEVLRAQLEAYPPGPDGRVFHNRSGRVLKARCLYGSFERARLRAGITRHLTPHSLRHFYASALIHLRVEVPVVQANLGHSSPSVTLNTYTHLWRGGSESARSALGNLFAARSERVLDLPGRASDQEK